MEQLKDNLKWHTSPFRSGVKTQVLIRESNQGENGRSVTFSFYGLDTNQTYDLILDGIIGQQKDHIQP
jgi:hypothetical protein